MPSTWSMAPSQGCSRPSLDIGSEPGDAADDLTIAPMPLRLLRALMEAQYWPSIVASLTALTEGMESRQSIQGPKVLVVEGVRHEIADHMQGAFDVHPTS